MKKQHILLLFILLSVGLQAQKTATGYILDKDSHAALEGVEVGVEGEEQRYTRKPGFQGGKIRIYLESYKPLNTYSEKRLEEDSLFPTFKNAVSISILEFFAVGVGLRYERFLAKKHAVGLHASYYFYGLSPSNYSDPSGYQSRATYTGFKMQPFYRFYPVRQKAKGLFLEAKIPFGYFDFDKITYRYRTTTHLTQSISPKFWTWGFGFSVGLMARIPGSKHGLVNFSLGCQYFPMVDVPKSIPREVSMGSTINLTADTSWWYLLGPGSYFEVKLTFGGIF